ncbi:DUF5000 domain-containing lipoprotein [Haoranjiania flava]|uniref:DUF5000 domain-containing lipoprotein n=1 Tax=Haoranjiania flava TaxID=1856322 RepID=A0AAE3LJR8_9BACT|nr:DUF5000 domain-containing lipoprotein [Haoranjiania flava]MCU7693659.1 DUF5000 domain-containing lipoprotein [Haoranjiania flava]
MKNLVILYVLLLSVLFFSCSKEKYVEPLVSDTAPAPVTQVTVEPLPGAAKISYKLPKDESLRYVKAVYEIRKGVEREVIGSQYNNFIVVDGFPSTNEYEVKLYSVSFGEQYSEPVSVKVQPSTPPLLEAYNTVKFSETFGGTTLTFENKGAASLAVMILTPDSSGRLSEVETYYTKSTEGRVSVRGFPAQPRLFAAVVRDRYGNLSDTITQTVTPVFEEKIPKDKFVEVRLANDTYEPHIPNGQMFQIWDDRIAPNGGIGVFHTKPGSGIPQSFTFDMGRITLLSRYKLWHRGPGTQWAYQLGAPKKWEVWGRTTAPDPQGSWEGWTKLMDCNSYKPSGEGPVTNEDALYATSTGEDFIFPNDIPPVRYLRFNIVETWGYLDYIYIQELTLWGQLQ